MLAIRLLILLLLAYLVFLVINIFFSLIRTNRLKQNRMPLDKGDELVLCPLCQSYVPRAEAVSSHGNYFCREECARLFTRTP